MKRKNKRPIKSAQAVNDGFANFTASLGVSQNSDNLLSQGFFEFNNYTKNREQLEAGYRTNWLCSSLVDCIANDMTRAGLQFTGEIDPVEISELETFWNRSGIMEDITDGIRWGRLYGGAIILIMTKGAKYDQPLNIASVKEGYFLGLSVYDRWDLTPDLTTLIQDGRDIGKPMYYTINSLSGLRVHHSHVIRFEGDKLPRNQAIAEMLWGASVIENVLDRIIAFETVTMGAANLSSRAHLRTVKVDGLRSIFAMGGQAEANLVKQFSYIRHMQNNEGITLLDKSDDFETSAYNFSGLDTIILQFVQQISGAKRIPLSILFGESPAGLNASGDSDIRIYYDGIASKQAPLDESIIKLARIAYQSKIGKPAPEDLGVKWNSLWQQTPIEKSTITKNTIDAINECVINGLFSRELALKEIKQLSITTGFGSNITDEDLSDGNPPEYSQPTDTIKSREEILNQAKELLTQ
jgi:phage-related protein (TIGR01555 family)